MSVSYTTTAGNVVVVTHVQPVAQGAVQGHYVGTHTFSKGRPLVLGTVEIMVGILVLLFGLCMVVDPDTLGVYSGIFAWGSIFYIIAGSLTVAAGKTFNRCLVNGALALNICAAVSSLPAIILHFLDAALLYYNESNQYISRMQGISVVLGIFHFLELVVSLTIAGFACNSTCQCCGQEPSVVVIPAGSQLPVPIPSQILIPSQIPVPSQTINNIPKNQMEQRVVDLAEPPSYSTS